MISPRIQLGSLMVLLAVGVASYSEVRAEESANVTAAAFGQPRPIDLKGKLPEEFDWKSYFSSGDTSTYSSYQLAFDAWHVMRRRLDDLCESHRSLLKNRNLTEALAVFDEMQAHWEKAAAAEIRFVGGSWEGGSGAKVAFASQRFEVYLRRVKELVALKGASLHLNE